MSAFFRRGKRKEPPAPPPSIPAQPDSAAVGSTTMWVSGDARRDTDRIRALVDSLREVSAQGDTKTLLVTMVDRAIRTVDAERGLLFVVDDEGRAPLRVARTAEGENLPRSVTWSTQVVSGVLEKGEAVCLKIDDSEDFDPSRSMVDLNLRAVLCVPLQSGDERLGVLYVDTQATNRMFTKADLRYFEAFADMLSIAWKNQKALEERITAERMGRDLALAHDIQSGLLPEAPLDVDGYSMCGRVLVADEAGGDYFDFFKTRDEMIAMALGDVSGHGVGAALVMAAGRAYVRAYCSWSRSPGAILRRVNRRLSQDTADDMFMSMFLCVLDPKTREFHYANAGQTRPVLVRGTSGEMEDYRVTGVALGVVEETDYEERGPFRLEAGDTVVMFSDGLTELRRGDEQYGRERLKASIAKRRSGSAQEMLDGIIADALAWGDEGGAKADDVTVAVLRADA